jgi:glycosyltransferase involved in cell wall biosynthesis
MAAATIAVYLGCRKETGGTFQYARTLLHALARACPPDLRIVALSPAGTEWREIAEQFDVQGRRVPALSLADRVAGKALRTLGGANPPRRLLSLATPLGRTLDALGAKVCLYTEYEHYSFELATPSLIPIHDLMHRYESRFSENRAYADPDGFFIKICNGAAGILVDSDVGRDQLVESYGPFPAAVHVLPYIPADYVYDESLLEPDPGVDALLESLPERFLFYPAQFWEHKNHVRLIDAVLAAAKRCPDIHLVLAGSPKNFYHAVVAHIEATGAAGRVSMLGYVSDAAKLALFRRARALVMPTFFGPTNIPPLEAFQLGCAVAASRIYAMPEQLGDAALFFDPASTDEMQDAIECLWTDDALCAELVHRGRERAAAWGPEQFSARLWEIVEATLGTA